MYFFHIISQLEAKSRDNPITKVLMCFRTEAKDAVRGCYLGIIVAQLLKSLILWKSLEAQYKQKNRLDLL